MNPAELGEEIAVELKAPKVTVNELLTLQRGISHREPGGSVLKKIWKRRLL